jgi:hypothetical protein
LIKEEAARTSKHRLHQIKRGFVNGASQSDEPPGLGPLRAPAEREELAGLDVILMPVPRILTRS